MAKKVIKIASEDTSKEILDKVEESMTLSNEVLELIKALDPPPVVIEIHSFIDAKGSWHYVGEFEGEANCKLFSDAALSAGRVV